MLECVLYVTFSTKRQGRRGTRYVRGGASDPAILWFCIHGFLHTPQVSNELFKEFDAVERSGPWICLEPRLGFDLPATRWPLLRAPCIDNLPGIGLPCLRTFCILMCGQYGAYGSLNFLSKPRAYKQ